jgi:hypothetical protein
MRLLTRGEVDTVEALHELDAVDVQVFLEVVVVSLVLRLVTLAGVILANVAGLGLISVKRVL